MGKPDSTGDTFENVKERAERDKLIPDREVERKCVECSCPAAHGEERCNDHYWTGRCEKCEPKQTEATKEDAQPEPLCAFYNGLYTCNRRLNDLMHRDGCHHPFVPADVAVAAKIIYEQGDEIERLRDGINKLWAVWCGCSTHSANDRRCMEGAFKNVL